MQWVAATGNYDASELNGVSFVISSVGDYTSMSMGGSINATLTLAAYDAMQLRYQTQFDPNQGLLSIWDISAATYEVRR